MVRACDHLAATQEPDGGWRGRPEPRILENGLVVLLAQRFVPELDADVDRACAFVLRARVQEHHPVPNAIDLWLKSATRRGPETSTLDLRHPSFADPVYANRSAFFASVATALGSPVLGAGGASALLERFGGILQARRASRLKSWSSAEVAALYLLLARGTGSMSEVALETLVELQSTSGSFGDNPISTMVALAALSVVRPQGEERRRALEYTRSLRAEDGTWRFCLAEVWDTALLCRAFSKVAHLMPTVWSRAESFVAGAQNADGGFPYAAGVESDTDTTGMATLALAQSSHAPSATERARQYLIKTRTDNGVWRTWHYRDDPPAEDAVAHAVMALKTSGAPPETWQRAVDWLAARADTEVGWRAHWYNIRAYAAHEVGMVLGRSHLATRYAARLLVEQQNPDGGWGVGPGLPSTAAATGLATSFLIDYFSVDHELVRSAVRYLMNAQGPGGIWGGATDMYAPRPFAVDYPSQTHALAAMGVIAVATKPRPGTRERRESRPPSEFLSVELPALTSAERSSS
jgi:squalene-hopene/tetraprenyl-beta-curcumene cyclase